MVEPRHCVTCHCIFDLIVEGGIEVNVGAVNFSLCPMCFDIVDGVFEDIHGCGHIDDDEEDYDEEDYDD